MTYRELVKVLSVLPNEQLDCDLTIYDDATNEFYVAVLNYIVKDNGVLEIGHPYIEIGA